MSMPNRYGNFACKILDVLIVISPILDRLGYYVVVQFIISGVCLCQIFCITSVVRLVNNSLHVFYLWAFHQKFYMQSKYTHDRRGNIGIFIMKSGTQQ
jgi:hypothetical protein